MFIACSFRLYFLLSEHLTNGRFVPDVDEHTIIRLSLVLFSSWTKSGSSRPGESGRKFTDCSRPFRSCQVYDCLLDSSSEHLLTYLHRSRQNFFVTFVLNDLSFSDQQHPVGKIVDMSRYVLQVLLNSFSCNQHLLSNNNSPHMKHPFPCPVHIFNGIQEREL